MRARCAEGADKRRWGVPRAKSPAHVFVREGGHSFFQGVTSVAGRWRLAASAVAALQYQFAAAGAEGDGFGAAGGA